MKSKVNQHNYHTNKYIHGFLELPQTWLVSTTRACVILEVNSCQSNIEVWPNGLNIFTLMANILYGYVNFIQRSKLQLFH